MNSPMIFASLFAAFAASWTVASSHRTPSPEVVISTDGAVARHLKKILPVREIVGKKPSDPNLTLLAIKAAHLDEIAAVMHRDFHRCGGFMVEEGPEQLAELTSPRSLITTERSKDLYAIDQQQLVGRLSAGVSEENLVSVIRSLSSNPNRYFRSSHGKASQQWLKDRWHELTREIPAVKVEQVNHADYGQPSVILTWTGKVKPEEVVILGGHGDSIAGFMSQNDSAAPGADDNASGIATITEVIRLLSSLGFQPERSVHLMSYAAEEVGLRGSNDIARAYKQRKVNVVGVMQLDMVNFSDERHDIMLITDNTDSTQNAFVKKLIASYLPQVTVGENPCGYACSDHASWTRQGFPASFPFEAAMDSYNPAIHTVRDTLERSSNHARHAVPFVTLAGAYVVELSSL